MCFRTVAIGKGNSGQIGDALGWDADRRVRPTDWHLDGRARHHCPQENAYQIAESKEKHHCPAFAPPAAHGSRLKATAVTKWMASAVRRQATVGEPAGVKTRSFAMRRLCMRYWPRFDGEGYAAPSLVSRGGRRGFRLSIPLCRRSPEVFRTASCDLPARFKFEDGRLPELPADRGVGRGWRNAGVRIAAGDRSFKPERVLEAPPPPGRTWSPRPRQPRRGKWPVQLPCANGGPRAKTRRSCLSTSGKLGRRRFRKRRRHPDAGKWA